MILYRFVIKKNYVNLLINLSYGEHTMMECSKFTGMNYAHLTIVLNEFVKEKIMQKIRKNNSFCIELTNKGRKIVSCLQELKKIIEKESE